jgi:hypothetical protein
MSAAGDSPSDEDGDDAPGSASGPKRLPTVKSRTGRKPDRGAQRVASIEGVNSEVEKFLQPAARCFIKWSEIWDRQFSNNLPAEWRPWGKVAENTGEHLMLRDTWLTLMACTSKVLQTVDNRHLNRHLDYLHSGPSIHFVDLQDTPSIGRRLQALGHFVECINNFGEFPLDCVVPTPETELLIGYSRGGKTVRGMRMKNPEATVSRTVKLTSTTARAGEKWLKSFKRGKLLYRTLLGCLLVPTPLWQHWRETC